MLNEFSTNSTFFDKYPCTFGACLISSEKYFFREYMVKKKVVNFKEYIVENDSRKNDLKKKNS